MSTYITFDNNPIFWADPSGADAVQYDIFGRASSINGRYIPVSDRKKRNEENSEEDKDTSSTRQERSAIIGAFIKTALASNQDYGTLKIFSGKDDEKNAYTYMRKFSKEKEREIAAWVTTGTIYVLPVDFDLPKDEANHKALGLKIEPIKKYLGNSDAQIAYSSFLKIGKKRITILAEVHTHLSDGSTSPTDESISRNYGILVFNIGPKYVRVTNRTFYDKSPRDIFISKTKVLLNGNASLRKYAIKYLKKNKIMFR